MKTNEDFADVDKTATIEFIQEGEIVEGMCEICEGSGGSRDFIDEPCNNCEGKGWVEYVY